MAQGRRLVGFGPGVSLGTIVVFGCVSAGCHPVDPVDDFIRDMQHGSVVGIDDEVGWRKFPEGSCELERPNLVPFTSGTHFTCADTFDQRLIARPKLTDDRRGAWDGALNLGETIRCLDDTGDDQIARSRGSAVDPHVAQIPQPESDAKPVIERPRICLGENVQVDQRVGDAAPFE